MTLLAWHQLESKSIENSAAEISAVKLWPDVLYHATDSVRPQEY